MNRLRVLKQRATRAKVGVCKLRDGWYVAQGTSFWDANCTGPLTRREAIFQASRIALPRKALEVTVTYG